MTPDKDFPLSTKSLLQDIVEEVPIRIFWKDRQGRYLGCNSLFARDAGFADPQQLVGKTDYEMGWHEQAELYRNDDFAVMESGEALLGYEEQQTTPDGGLIWVRTSKVPLRDEHRQVIGILGIYEEITARKQNEESLLLTQFVSDRAPDSIFWVDKDGYFCYVNDAACDGLGIPREELLGMRLPDIAPEFPEAAWTEHWQALQQNRKLTFETLQRCRNGRIFPVEVCANFVAFDKFEYSIAYVRDISERRQVEEQLRASESRFRALIEQSPLAMQFVALDGVTTAVNPAWEQLWGVPLAALFNYNLRQDQQLIAKGVMPLIVRAFAGEKVEVPELEYDKAATTEVPGQSGRQWVRTHLCPVKDDSGHVRELVLIQEDISERKQAEAALHESQTRHEEAQRIAQLGHWSLDLVAERLEWSDETYRIFGLARDAGVSLEKFQESIHPADRDAVMQAFKESIDKRSSYDIEHRLLLPDGTVKWVHERCETQYAADGTPLFSTGTVHDVTARKRAEKRLRLSEERFQLAMLGANDGLWDWNLETGEVYFSPRWFTMLGYRPEAFPPEIASWWRLIHPEERGRVRQQVRDYLTGRIDSLEMELRMRHQNGHDVLVLSRATKVLRESDSKPIRLVGTHVDMTERRELEAQLRQSQKMESLGTLVGGIAHDFNNILAAIMGYVDLAMDQARSLPGVVEKLDKVEQLGQRAAEMVRQLLMFARKSGVTLKPLSLNQFLNQSFLLASTGIRENIDKQLEVSAEELFINGDTTQLQQMLLNLLNNAAEAVDGIERPRISCRLCRYQPDAEFEKHYPALADKQLACLSVTDNGVGIPVEQQKKIFEPFFTTKDIGMGTGLGLAMVYGAVQSHGGVVEVESEPGCGTVFHVYLPLSGEAPVPRAVLNDSRGPFQPVTVLLVDDEASVREVARELLSSLGCQVFEAGDGESALELFREQSNTIELLISDMVMPKMSGLELLQRARQLKPQLAAVLMSGYDKNHLLETAPLPERSRLLSKPFSLDHLKQTILSLMDESCP